MAYMESKVIQVANDPAVINGVNKTNAAFGWMAWSTQVTNSQNTEIYQDFFQYGTNEFTVKTTTINYATLTYQRDTNMPHYNELVALENEYTKVMATYNSLNDRGVKWGVQLAACIIAGTALSVFEVKGAMFGLMSSLALIAGVVLAVRGARHNRGIEEANNARRKQLSDELAQIEATAEGIRRRSA